MREMTRKTVIFLGGARDFHVMDWFRSAQRLNPENPPVLATDLIESESFEKLIKPADKIEKLFIIDKFLSKQQSTLGHIWRNLVKLLFLPIQILKFRQLLKKYKNAVVHAYNTYYIMIARFSNCQYVSTPQGYEVLERAVNSPLYRFFLGMALSRSGYVTVDSIPMRNIISEKYRLASDIVRKGIDMEKLEKAKNPHGSCHIRKYILSIRGISPIYQLEKVLTSRNRSMPSQPVCFCYPFFEKEYWEKIWPMFIEGDRDLGKLEKLALYKILQSTKLVISIPRLDSSPTSVYEAIFSGCFVAAVYDQWFESLPDCMRERVIMVDLASDDWFLKVVNYADANIHKPFVPSEQALRMFDKRASTEKFYREIYPSLR